MSPDPARVTSATATDAVDADNPWPGLVAFREADQEYFHGRQREAEDLQRLVMRERLTVLFGLSGLGKSSLLQAGLFPLVRMESVFPVYVRLDYSPKHPDLVAQIKDAIGTQAAAADIEAPVTDQTATLWEYLHRRDADFWSRRNRPLAPLLVLDQFEEIFTLGRLDTGRVKASEALIDQLSDLAEGRPPPAVKARLEDHPEEAATFAFGRHHYKMLLSIREDFLPELEGLRARFSAVALNRFRLRRMNGEAALRVVNQAPHLIEPAVAEEVVRFVAAGRANVPLAALEVEPALLSVVCRELNNKRRQLGEPRISPELLEGSQEEVLSGFFESCVSDLPEEARSFIEERLLTASGYRDSVALENALGAPGMSRAFVDRLVERRLVRIDDRGGAQRLELTHDLLTGVVRASRDRRRQREATEQERIARQEAQERERRALVQLRRSRRMAAAFLALMLAAVGAAVWAFLAQREAARQERSARAALARSAVQDADRLVANDRRDQALAQLARAVRLDPDSIAANGGIVDLLRRSWWLPGPPARHESAVLGTVFGTTGPRAVTVSEDGVRVSDAVSGKPIAELIPYGGWQLEATAIAGGRRLVIEAMGKQTLLLDADSGKRIGESIHYAIASVSADGHYLLTVSYGEPMRVWEADTGEQVGRAISQKFASYDLATGGRRILTASEDGGARVWDTQTGAPVGEALRPDGRINSAKFSPDGRRVLTVLANETARVWDTETGQAIGETLRHGAFIGSGAFSGDGRRVLTTSVGTARVWDTEGGTALGELLHHDGCDFAVLSQDGSRVLTASKDSARVWDAESGRPLGEPLRQQGPITSAALSPDGRRVMTASDRTTRVWDRYNEQPVGASVLLRFEGGIAGLSADGRRVLTRDGESAHLWDLESGGPVGQTFRFEVEGFPIGFSPDGRRMLSAAMRVWDAETGKPLSQPLTHEEAASFSFTRDGRRLLTTSQSSAILWDIERSAPVGQPLPQSEGVPVALNGDGSRMLRVFKNGTVGVWDVDGGKSIGAPLPHKGENRFAEFSPDGRRALLASFDGPARLLNADSGRLVGGALPEEDVASAGVFSPDGRRALIASTDGTVRVLDAITGMLVGQPFRHSSPVAAAAFNGVGNRVVTSHEDGTTRLWDADSLTPIGEPLKHDNEKCPVRFSPDGSRVVTHAGAEVRVFDADTGRPIGEPLPHRRAGVCAVFSADRRGIVTTPEEESIQVWELGVVTQSQAEASRLADLAEAVSTYRVNDLGSLESLENHQERLADLRRVASRASKDERTVSGLVRRFFFGSK